MNVRASKVTTGTMTATDHLHLLGGLRSGTGKDGKLIVHPVGTPLRQVPVLSVNVMDKGQYVGFFRSIGLDLIGVEEFHVKDGYTYSSWRSWDREQKSLETDLNFIWGGLANAYRENGDAHAAVQCANVNFALRAVSQRLKGISDAYAAQNAIAFCSGKKEGLWFKNTETIDVYLAIHSFLAEMGTLRDYIAAYVAQNRFKIDNVTRMSVLFKRCTNLTDDPVADEIVAACDKTRPASWLAGVSAFRDHTIHVAPITSRTGGRGFAVRNCRIGEHVLPTVYLNVSPLGEGSGEEDALSHCLTLYRRMLTFSRLVAEHSGVSPKPFHITDADLR